MKVKSLYEITRRILITFGIISIFPGIFAFFSFLSYKSWSVCLTSPNWNGALWEASFAFGILSITGASVQFAAAVASLLLGPYCYHSLAGIAGMGYAVLLPCPCTDFPNLSRDPLHYKWYHLPLQILDLCSSLAMFCASLVFVMTFVRLLQFGHSNISIGQGRWIATCNAINSSQEGGTAVQGQTDPECTHITINSAPAAMCIIPLNHFMNQ
ncbi:LOW QUALITY PROTEIN: transmembrane protein 212 [Pterocles gutturalis]